MCRGGGAQSVNRGTREGFLEVATLTQCGHGPSASAWHSPMRVSRDLTPSVGHQSLVSTESTVPGSQPPGKERGQKGEREALLCCQVPPGGLGCHECYPYLLDLLGICEHGIGP